MRALHLRPDVQHASLTAYARIAARVSAVRVYTVRKGDTLSSIAARYLGSARRWQGLWAANRGTVRNPNVIQRGQRLRIITDHLTGGDRSYLRHLAAPWHDHPGSFTETTAHAVRHYSCGDGDGDGFDMPCWKLYGHSAPASPANPAPAAPAAVPVSYGGGYPGGAFGACVVRAESGGNPQVMNATGHYGLYQFSAQTWAAYGGNPADFGNASAAEQNQVFANALAQGGQSNWSPYDGC
jgi:phage tail protein X